MALIEIDGLPNWKMVDLSMAMLKYDDDQWENRLLINNSLEIIKKMGISNIIPKRFW